MVHDRFEFVMPAPADVAFDAFHYHYWRSRWDSLVSATHVIGGHSCPYVGAVTQNAGSGWMRPLSMQTQFLSFDRPKVAATTMIGKSFPFSRWAASLNHREIDEDSSMLIYTYTFSAGPRLLAFVVEPIIKLIFDWQTRHRFLRMQAFLAIHRSAIAEWQCSEHPTLSKKAPGLPGASRLA